MRHIPIWGALIATATMACGPSQPPTTATAIIEPSTEPSTPLVDQPDPPADPTLEDLNAMDLSPAGYRAAKTLRDAKSFGGWAVGYAGAPLPEVAAMRTLLNEPDGAPAFRYVMAHGTMAGQLLALSGLYYADHDNFLVALEPYRKSAEMVSIHSNGCSAMERGEKVSRIVEAPGALEVLGPDETLKQMWSRTSGTGFVVYDIAHGGYPINLRGE